MKRKAVLTTVLSLVIVTADYGLVLAHGEDSRGGSGGSWFGMGPGHMGGSSWRHMGSGGHMMGSGWEHMGSGNHLRFDGSVYGHDHRRSGRGELTSEAAREIAEHSLGGNPYLRIGEVTRESDGFKVEIVTRKSRELVNRLLIHKETGRVFPVDE